jgi:putative transcriptional regulator
MRKPKSEIAEAVHETAKDLYRVGLIDRVRMREYDSLCLKPICISLIQYVRSLLTY